MIHTGIKGHLEQIVTDEVCADRIGSGLVKVFATPMMIALIEQTCNESVVPLLEAGQGTVGTHVNVSHSAPRLWECGYGATASWLKLTAGDSYST